jgi:acyl-CoA synthetase (AMP-forming)/AMP-acid ligase II
MRDAASLDVPLPATFRPVTMGSGIRASAGRDPGKIALRCEGRTLTYAALVERIGRVAALLRHGFGLAPGERVAIVAPNGLEYIEIVTGAAEAGLCIATVNPRQTAAEIGHILGDCGARAVFTTPALEPLVRAADAPAIEHIVLIGEPYEALLARASATPELPRVEEWDAFAMPYTSGTTGKPRGVTLPHRSRVMTMLGMASEYGCYGPDDDYLAIAPLFHGAGYCFAHAAVFLGGSCEILTQFDAETVIARLHEGGHSGTFMVPTHFHAIFALPEKLRERHRGVRLKALVSNAAALPQRTKERIVEYFGEGILHETYGSTEAAIVTNLRPADQLRKLQCVGRPFTMNEVKLLDSAGEPVRAGEVGELYSNSPYLFLGYWGQPEATAASMREGWFSAGDLARMDEEGFIYLVDRKKDMFISGGVNVYPREIEEVLFRLPGVREAAVIGVPDEYWGEVGRAFLVPQPDAQLEPEAVLAACRELLAGHKVPKHVALLDALPRNAAGKVLKTELRTRS